MAETVDLQRLVVQMEASLVKYERSMAKMQATTRDSMRKVTRETDRSMADMERRTAQAAAHMEASMAQARSMAIGGASMVSGGIAAAAGFGLGAFDLVARVQEVQDLDTRLRGLTGSAEAAAQETAYLQQTAKDLNADVLVLTKGYAGLLVQVQGGIITTAEARKVLEGYANVQAKTGATNAQVEQSFYGLSQGLGQATLMTDEYNQIVEPMPGLSNALDRSLAKLTGTTENVAGSFKRAVGEGQITQDILKRVLVDALATFDGAAAATSDDISARLRRVNNAYTELAREFEKTLADPFADVLASVAQLIPLLGEVVNGIRDVRRWTDDLPLPQWLKDFNRGGPIGLILRNTGQSGRNRDVASAIEKIEEEKEAIAKLQYQLDTWPDVPTNAQQFADDFKAKILAEIEARAKVIADLRAQMQAAAAPTADDWMLAGQAAGPIKSATVLPPIEVLPAETQKKRSRASTIDRDLLAAQRLIESLRGPYQTYLATLREEEALRPKLIQAIQAEAKAAGERITQQQAEAKAAEVLAAGRERAYAAMVKEVEQTPAAIAAAKAREDALERAAKIREDNRTPEEVYQAQRQEVISAYPVLAEQLGHDEALRQTDIALERIKDAYDDMRGVGVRAWQDIGDQMISAIGTARSANDVLEQLLLTLVEIGAKAALGLGPAGGFVNQALGVGAGGLLGALFGGGSSSASGVGGLTAADDWMLAGIPGFASGGRHAGGWRVVGERGPELEYTGPSQIVPADITRRILSGASGSTSQSRTGGQQMTAADSRIGTVNMTLAVDGVMTQREVQEMIAAGYSAAVEQMRRETPGIVINTQRRGTR